MGGSVMNRENCNLMFVMPLSDRECCAIRGGAGDWDKDVAGYIGVGLGYGVKKLWRAFKFMSANLYDLQGRTQVIYK